MNNENKGTLGLIMMIPLGLMIVIIIIFLIREMCLDIINETYFSIETTIGFIIYCSIIIIGVFGYILLEYSQKTEKFQKLKDERLKMIKETE